MKKVPFYLLTGFLGSGKTTLLKRILETHAESMRIAVIQNEFADMSVDAVELQRTGRSFHLLEINKGSVFCVCLMADFTTGCAAMIGEYKPDAVVLEATGLADPIAVAQLLEHPQLRDILYLCHTWAVVDASTFIKMEPVVKRMSHQVRIADTVVVNKTDRADPATLESVHQRVREINPYAAVIATRECDVPLVQMFLAPVESTWPSRDGCDDGRWSASQRPDVASASLRTTRRIAREDLDRFLGWFAGSCHRIKGFVLLDDGECVAVQCAMGEIRVGNVDGYQGPTELVALGPGLDVGEFRQRFIAGTMA